MVSIFVGQVPRPLLGIAENEVLLHPAVIGASASARQYAENTGDTRAPSPVRGKCRNHTPGAWRSGAVHEMKKGVARILQGKLRDRERGGTLAEDTQGYRARYS